GPVSSTFQDLILNKREIENTITVDDGQIVAIGGLLDDNDRRTIERVPLLGDIPIIGELVRGRSRAHARTTLMVFIRPTILRSAEETEAMSARRFQYMRGRQLLFDPDHEPSLDELVRDYMGATPPTPRATPADVIVPPPPSPPAAQGEDAAPAAGPAPAQPPAAGKPWGATPPPRGRAAAAPPPSAAATGSPPPASPRTAARRSRCARTRTRGR